MKIGLIGIALAGFLLLFGQNAHAQAYDVYYYWDGSQYQQYWPQYALTPYGNVSQYPEQLYDPYYQLHVLHYQLYLPQYQSYFAPYPPYLVGPCCFGGGVIIPSPRRHAPVNHAFRASPVSPLPQIAISPLPQPIRRR